MSLQSCHEFCMPGDWKGVWFLQQTGGHRRNAASVFDGKGSEVVDAVVEHW